MSYELNDIIFALAITLFAGLSTGIGSILAFYTKQTNKKFLSGALGFSAGVMIYVSMIEIFPEARDSLEAIYGANLGYVYTTIAFFAGIGLIALIDIVIPESENPHHMGGLDEVGEISDEESEKHDLKRTGMFTALAIAIHNFPEGLATFIGAMEDPALGVSIGIAIAIHNIPEGIAVSVPIYYATGSKKKAFKYSFLSGLAEPLGGIVGFLLLRTVISDAMFGVVFAAVAGIMVYISLDELLPTAEKYGEHHIAIFGTVLGMMVMALSLVLLN